MHAEVLSIRVFARVADIRRLLRVRRARLRNIARVAREFLQYWYLSSHVVQTSKQNRAKQ